MILLRPTINLYYDKIVKEVPIPNGVFSYDFTKDRHKTPINLDKNSPVASMTYLFNTLKVLDVPNLQLFSGKDTAPNLFYPLELKLDLLSDYDISDFINDKTLSRIRKGKMKLLLFLPWISHNYKLMLKLKDIIKKLQVKGITNEMIFIVLGDLNRTYRNLFENQNVYGIDWWQIYAQISYNSRYRLKDWYWVYREFPSFPLADFKIEEENFQFENWKPTRLFTALTGKNVVHNTAFISELIYRNLDGVGKYSYNLSNNMKRYFDPRIINRDKKTYFEKMKIIDNINSKLTVLDCGILDIKRDRLALNKNVYEESLFNIVSGSFSPPLGNNYLDEIEVLSPGLGVWRQIAKGHPFMYLGCLNTMGYISNEGYFLPTQITNHFYDRITDVSKKVKLICDSIEQIASENIDSKLQEMIPFMQRNRERFFNKPNKRKFEQLFREMTYE